MSTRFIRIVAGDMSDPQQVARSLYEALQRAARTGMPDARSRAINGAAKADDWTSEKRRKLQAGEIDGEFAGPGTSFPITDENDVRDAWNLAGHADNPDAVRAKIISIARKRGLAGGLPKTALEWEAGQKG